MILVPDYIHIEGSCDVSYILFVFVQVLMHNFFQNGWTHFKNLAAFVIINIAIFRWSLINPHNLYGEDLLFTQ